MVMNAKDLHMKRNFSPRSFYCDCYQHINNLLRLISDHYRTIRGRFKDTLLGFREMNNEKLMKEIWHSQCFLKSKQCLGGKNRKKIRKARNKYEKTPGNSVFQ